MLSSQELLDNITLEVPVKKFEGQFGSANRSRILLENIIVLWIKLVDIFDESFQDFFDINTRH